MSTFSLVRAVKVKFRLFSSCHLKQFFQILPFNWVVKSATADLVLLNSVLVEAKFVVAVSKSFEVAEQTRLIILKQVNKFKEK
jgi:hypothetical protein